MATNPTPNRLAGIANVTIDGITYLINGSGSYKVSAGNRETLKGQDGVHGYKEMPDSGSIKWTSRDGKGISIAALNAADNATVTLSLANGKIIVGRNMWRVGDPIEVDTEEASFDIAFEGPDVAEF